MKTVGIIGYGELGRQILGLLSTRQRPDRVIRFDDGLHRQGAEESFPFDGFLDPRFKDLGFYVGLGYRHLPRRAEIIGQLVAAGRSVPALVHPIGHVAPTCRVGAGCLVYPSCNLDQEVELEPGVLLNNSVVVSHNSRVGAAAYLSPGVVLSGYVTVGAGAFLGSGTLVANNRRIGAHARVAIGSVITRDVQDGESVAGSPQRLLDHPLELE